MKTRMMQIVWAIALCIPISIQAQHTIQGTVKSSNGETLAGVKITLEGLYSGTFSDEQGQYRFSQLKPGNYVLITHLLGYEPTRNAVTLTDKDETLNLTVSPSALMIEEVQVSGVRADDKTPTTHSTLTKSEISKANYGQDLPFLLETTPSTVVTSDAGAGVGYTGVRIRGVDPTRTNVTINGIPINDAESHGTFWVNMPDFASSSDNIQVQRGVGTSSNGAAAFGASINIKSDNIERKPYAEVDNSVGSFSTFRTTVKGGTGLINNQFAFDARLSRIVSDGFIDRAASNLKSFYLSGAWVGKKSLIKANLFSGHEVTYQAWWGVPEWKYKQNDDSLLTHFYNNYYPGGMYETAQDSANLFNSNPETYNYYTYENETDNYRQDHYQLHFTHAFNSKWSLNIAGHYTRGRGYYEQYRRNDDFATYGFNPVVLGGDTVTSTDLIRRRWLDNHFYGGIFSLTYTNHKNLKVIIGGGMNNYEGGHYGEVIWARFAAQSEIRDRYYENDAQKMEANGYIKANYQAGRFNFFVDLQGRFIDYSYLGMDESFGVLVPLAQAVNFTFFNPKAGLTYDFNEKNNLYASYSVANREPVRGDFIESSATSRPSPEQLQDLEVGYRHKSGRLLVNFNYFLMNYKDQLILTGQINDVGGYTRTNVAKSYRTGVELDAAYKLLKKLSISGNLMLSQNKIQNYNEYVDNYDNYDVDGNMIQDVIAHSNTDIAFSPNIIGGLGVHYRPVKNLDISLFGKYVGAQFLDNTSSTDRQLDAYFISNLRMSYSFYNIGFREITIGGVVNNLFNERYANNGYTWGYVAGGRRIVENFYFPQAGRHFLVRLTLKF